MQQSTYVAYICLLKGTEDDFIFQYTGLSIFIKILVFLKETHLCKEMTGSNKLVIKYCKLTFYNLKFSFLC